MKKREKAYAVCWPYSKMVAENADPKNWNISVLCRAIVECGEVQLSKEQQHSVRALKDLRNHIVNMESSKMDGDVYKKLEEDLTEHYKRLLGESKAKKPLASLTAIRDRKK